MTSGSVSPPASVSPPVQRPLYLRGPRPWLPAWELARCLHASCRERLWHLSGCRGSRPAVQAAVHSHCPELGHRGCFCPSCPSACAGQAVHLWASGTRVGRCLAEPAEAHADGPEVTTLPNPFLFTTGTHTQAHTQQTCTHVHTGRHTCDPAAVPSGSRAGQRACY